jgi:hypothetical protein
LLLLLVGHPVPWRLPAQEAMRIVLKATAIITKIDFFILKRIFLVRKNNQDFDKFMHNLSL